MHSRAGTISLKAVTLPCHVEYRGRGVPVRPNHVLCVWPQTGHVHIVITGYFTPTAEFISWLITKK